MCRSYYTPLFLLLIDDFVFISFKCLLVERIDQLKKFKIDIQTITTAAAAAATKTTKTRQINKYSQNVYIALRKYQDASGLDR